MDPQRASFLGGELCPHASPPFFCPLSRDVVFLIDVGRLILGIEPNDFERPADMPTNISTAD